MLVIVLGCGRLGAGLAKVLAGQGHDVVVVDEAIDRKRLGSDFDGVTIAGSPVDEDVLRRAGIADARLVVAATPDDNTNVMAIQVAKEVFHVPMVLARISDPDREKFYRGLGLNTVCPTATGINQILDLIQTGALSILPGWIDPDLVGVKPDEAWVGKPMGEIRVPGDRSLVGVATRSGEASLDPQRAIGKDDTLILVRRPRGKGGGACTS